MQYKTAWNSRSILVAQAASDAHLKPPPRPLRSRATAVRSEQPPAEIPAPAKTPEALETKDAAKADSSKTMAFPAASKKKGEIDLKERAKHGKFSFDFSKAEIEDIVKAISDMTQRNFIIPDSIKGKRLTILSPTKISAAEAYQVFLSALEVSDISVVRIGKFYKLMKTKEAIRAPIPTCVNPDDPACPKYSEQMVTTILPLQHIEVGQINSVLQSLKSREGQIQIFQPSNALIISEYANNLERIRRIISALDIPGFDDELQIIQIKYATATEIADKLTQIFEVAARGGANSRNMGGRRATPIHDSKTASKLKANSDKSEDDTEVQISKMVADDRTNQIIFKANRRSFEAIRSLISKLDVPISETEQGRVHVYYLENASAEELASTLSSLAQGSGNTQSSRPPRPARVPGQSSHATTSNQSKGVESATLFEGEIKITADKATNSLIIISSGRDYRSLSRIIEKLDRPRRQVYVEAAILEVTVGDTLKAGLNYHVPTQFANGDLPGGSATAGSIGFVQSAGGSGTIAAYQSPAQLLSVAGGALAGVFGKSLTWNIGGNSLSLPSFGIILQLLEESSNARILSTPHILTTDNEEASIEIGQKIPFMRGTSLSSLGAAASTNATLNSLSSLSNLYSSVDRVDVSLKLTLTPQINERGRIKLKIDQQVEDIVGEQQVTATPTTANRSAKTVVVVDDQQTVVIGGLMRDRVTDGETKVPILGDIPIIGWLFKNRTHKVEKVNLLLVLTPYIIRNSNDFQEILERKMEEYENFAIEYYGSIPEYRAHIDYSRKRGPFANMVNTLRREQNKAENGGSGAEDEIVIKPLGAKSSQLKNSQDENEEYIQGEDSKLDRDNTKQPISESITSENNQSKESNNESPSANDVQILNEQTHNLNEKNDIDGHNASPPNDMAEDME
ncbi:MAG: type II secretion system secretin GspD [Deltaproteobacteria bacterium]|nr:type II secretion system secretin GspD [Deltaproteobacteria bacterium]